MVAILARTLALAMAPVRMPVVTRILALIQALEAVTRALAAMRVQVLQARTVVPQILAQVPVPEPTSVRVPVTVRLAQALDPVATRAQAAIPVQGQVAPERIQASVMAIPVRVMAALTRMPEAPPLALAMEPMQVRE